MKLDVAKLREQLKIEGSTWGEHAARPPSPLPHDWRKIEQRGDGAAYRHDKGLAVIVSADIEEDGKRWLRVSFSRAHRIPDYNDVRQVKHWFVGPGRTAYQVHPDAEHHVNPHPNTLHLWCCLDGDPLPDFTRGTGSI